MKEKTRKKPSVSASADIKTYIKEMKVNKMYELSNNTDFKWAMIEHNEFGYCWTMGYRGMCTTIYSTDAANDIKYWTTEAEAKDDLIRQIYKSGS